MLTICRGEPKDYNQASEFMDVSIEDLDKYNNYYAVLRRDIYLLVRDKVHEAMKSTRRQFFGQIKYKKLNGNLIDDFVNAALVETHLSIIQGVATMDVLLTLRFKANKEDWGNIYYNAMCKKEDKIKELKQSQKNRNIRYRRWHIKRMSLSTAPTITSIENEITAHYKCDGNIKPKAKTKTKASIYEYWDEGVIKADIDEDDEDDYDLTPHMSSKQHGIY